LTTPDATLPVVHHVTEWQHWLHVIIGGAPKSRCGLRLDDERIPDLGPDAPHCPDLCRR
jgi:hypothetical protein